MLIYFQIIYWYHRSLVNDSLVRVSCLLATKRLEGNHTYDVLAKTMVTKFDKNNKISHTTTDNEENVVKSFK